MADLYATSSGKSLHRRSYPEYKDSGVEWLGEIPAHWTVGRVKECASVWLSNVDKKVVEGEPRVRLCNYTDVYYNERIDSQLDFMQATAKPEQVRRFSLKRGDVLITKDSETWTDIAVPAVVTEDLPNVLCGYHLALIRPKPHCLGAFLTSAIGAAGLQDQYRVSANGITRFGLTGDAIRNSVLPLPPLAEQRSITDFIDRETAKIDELVAKQEQLIDLMQERRTALITGAVTRGLDPKVPMKDSGVEWLGEVPAHWEAQRVKWVARVESGHTPDKKVEAYWTDGDIPWVSLNDTRHLKNRDYIRDTEYYTNELGLRNSSARLLPRRSVIFSRDATIGLCAITERSMAVSQHFIAWICNEILLPEYLLRVLDAMQGELARLTMGATLRTIGMPDVRTLTTPVPPVLEQDRIVTFVRKETVAIDALIAKVGQAIDILGQFRTALISAAVTGKIDVRNGDRGTGKNRECRGTTS